MFDVAPKSALGINDIFPKLLEMQLADSSYLSAVFGSFLC